MSKDNASTAGSPMLIDVPERLEGRRVILRCFAPEDGAALWPAVEESREEIDLWQDWHPEYRNAAGSEVHVRDLRIKFLRRECLYFGIWSRVDDRFLGFVGVESINWSIPSFHVGCWLRTSAARRGFMTEALALLCRLCFDGLQARRVAFLAESRNLRSAALARRLGFVLEGELRNDSLDTAREPRNTLVFALTPADYRDRLDLIRRYAGETGGDVREPARGG